MKNQPIEAWWNILTEGPTQEWKIYFAELEIRGYLWGVMYFYPTSGQNYKMTIILELLEELEAQVSDYDLDLYLPENTLILYGNLLQKGRYPKEFSYEGQIYKEAYIYLRERVLVSKLVENGGELELLSTRSGTAEWIEAHADHEIEQHRAMSMVINKWILIVIMRMRQAWRFHMMTSKRIQIVQIDCFYVCKIFFFKICYILIISFEIYSPFCVY